MSETITVEVKPEHLERARAKAKKRNFERTCQCLIAEACKHVVPGFDWCGVESVFTIDGTHNRRYRICESAQRLIPLFDGEKYDEIHLPQTITLTRCE